MAHLKTGLIGAGVFGGYHAGKIAASEKTDFIGVFDPDSNRRTGLADMHDVTGFASQEDLLETCDAVLIACPAKYHEAVLKDALEAGCHALVEKPLALTMKAATQIVALAKAQDKVLQVGHQERFVLDAMGLFNIPETPTEIRAVRAGPPAPDGRASDVSVIWDLMIHDMDLVGKLMGPAVSVTAEGRRAHTHHVDEASVIIRFGHGTAELTASRCADDRDRRMDVTYPSGTISLNFLTRSIENSTGYDITADVSDIIPDPLGAADEAFFEAALGLRDCPIPGHEAARAVSFAELAEHDAIKNIRLSVGVE